MSPDQMPWFREELQYLHRSLAGFAERHPEAAARAGLNGTTPADPQVHLLIQAVASLTARIRRRLEGGWGETRRAVLEWIDPLQAMVVPSLQIVQFAGGAAGEVVPRGGRLRPEAELGADDEARDVEFRTTRETVLWPVEVAAVQLQ